MNEPRRHHYVPRFYLEFFASPDDKGRPVLCVYDKEGGEPRPQAASTTCVECGFYSFENPEGKEDAELERALSVIESAAAPVLKRLGLPGETLVEQDIHILSQFLALLHVRVPRSQAVVSEIISVAIQQYIKGQAGNREKIHRYFQETKGSNSRMSEEEFAKLLSESDQHFKPVINPKVALREGLSTFPKFADILLKMNWCLCRAPEGRNFLTSDSPLCISVRDKDGRMAFGGGLVKPTVEVAIPISPSSMLVLNWHRNQRSATVGEHFVNEMNRRTAWSAQRYVISTRRSRTTAALVREASVTRNLPKMHPEDLKRRVEEKWREFSKK